MKKVLSYFLITVQIFIWSCSENIHTGPCCNLASRPQKSILGCWFGQDIIEENLVNIQWEFTQKNDTSFEYKHTKYESDKMFLINHGILRIINQDNFEYLQVKKGTKDITSFLNDKNKTELILLNEKGKSVYELKKCTNE